MLIAIRLCAFLSRGQPTRNSKIRSCAINTVFEQELSKIYGDQPPIGSVWWIKNSLWAEAIPGAGQHGKMNHEHLGLVVRRENNAVRYELNHTLFGTSKVHRDLPTVEGLVVSKPHKPTYFGVGHINLQSREFYPKKATSAEDTYLDIKLIRRHDSVAAIAKKKLEEIELWVDRYLEEI